VPKPLEIRLATGVPREERARAQLLRLCKEYDLSRWQFTDLVQIQDSVIPHSHPVLTLNTIPVDDDLALATYVHEQLHWFLIDWEAMHPEGARAADRELVARYSSVPREDDGGARHDSSAYLHLFVCSLEFASLVELIGAERARSTVESSRVYRWVYDTILAEWDYFEDFLSRYGLVVP
jgi:hypothetical protein